MNVYRGEDLSVTRFLNYRSQNIRQKHNPMKHNGGGVRAVGCIETSKLEKNIGLWENKSFDDI